MRVYVVVCEEWGPGLLPGEMTTVLVGVYRTRVRADWASTHDDHVLRAYREGYKVIEAEVEPLEGWWERTWRWLEGWVDAAPWPRV